MYYRINSPNVVREYFDGEIVVVNLESGTYYSLENTSALIWALFEDGKSVEESAEHLSKVYSKSIDETKPLIEKFAKNLVEQELIVGMSQPADVGDLSDSLVAQINVNPTTYSEPALKKYTDMQDLLLLDPIHDVDAAGWPMPKQPDSK